MIKEQNSVFVNFPAKIAKNKESVEVFKTYDGTELAKVTLPYGTIVNDCDVGGYSFITPINTLNQKIYIDETVYEYGYDKLNFPGMHSVVFPMKNSYGNHWEIILKRDFPSKDNEGKRIKGNDGKTVWETKIIKVTSCELKAAMEQLSKTYNEYCAHQREALKLERTDASINCDEE